MPAERRIELLRRRKAMEIAAKLPEDPKDALAILELCKALVTWTASTPLADC